MVCSRCGEEAMCKIKTKRCKIGTEEEAYSLALE